VARLADAERENEDLNNSVVQLLQAVAQLSNKDLTAKAPVTANVIGTCPTPSTCWRTKPAGCSPR
jgi:hypothetical protein